MKALVKTKPERGLEFLEVEKPKPEKGELLVRVKATTICGTDLHIFQWNDWARQRLRLPLIIGHEVAGEIVELGEGVESFEKGELVSAETHVYCNECFQCRIGNQHICEKVKIFGVDTDGVFAEYAVIPAQNAWKNPKGMKPEIASIQEPFGNAVHSVFAGRDRIEDSTVLITGAGPIGCFASAISKAAGARKVIVSDLNDYRLEIARKMKADVLVNVGNESLVEIVKRETNGRGADILLEMSGNPNALNDGLKALRGAGRVSILGIYSKSFSIDVTNDVVFNYARIFGINGRRIFETWQKTRELLEKKLVDPTPVITHRFPLREFEKGFLLLEKGEAGKVVLFP